VMATPINPVRLRASQFMICLVCDTFEEL